MRRLLPLFALLALLVAPFGRMGLAEAAATPHHAAPMAMVGHCEPMPVSDHGQTGKAAIDCMIACAAVTPAQAPGIAPVEPATLAPQSLPLFAFAGIRPEADPPPPRVS